MKRITPLFLVVVLAVGLGVILVGNASDSEKVYTLAELQQARTAQPAAWVGRTVLVRGRFVDVGGGSWGMVLPPINFSSCGSPQRGVVIVTSSGSLALVVVPAKGVSFHTAALINHEPFLNSVLASVACLPVVGGLVPVSAVENASTLRLRFVLKHLCTSLIDPKCPDAVLLQAGP
jgi:hypothetical protein